MIRTYLYTREDKRYELNNHELELVQQVYEINKDSENADAAFLEKFARWAAGSMGDCIKCGRAVELYCFYNSDDDEVICLDCSLDGDEFSLNETFAQAAESEAAREAAYKEQQEKRAARHAAINAQGFEVCDRCDGYGVISSYIHVNGGVCFKCGGTGSGNFLRKGEN